MGEKQTISIARPLPRDRAGGTQTEPAARLPPKGRPAPTRIHDWAKVNIGLEVTAIWIIYENNKLNVQNWNKNMVYKL